MTVLNIARTHARVTRRRGSLWFAIVPLTALGALLAFVSPAAPRTGGSADLAFTAQMIALFSGVAYAAAFTDFFTSRARRSMDEIEAAAPTSPFAVNAGRVIGMLGIILVPSALVLVGLGIFQAFSSHLAGPLVALGAVLAIMVPSLLIATCLSAFLGTFLPQGVARVAAVLVWLWAVFSTPLIPVPTLNGTVLNLVGDTTAAGLFGAAPIYTPAGALGLEPTALTAAVSLIWQLLLVVVLLTVSSVITYRRRQR